MPEGPEIRREADRVADALVGRIAERVWFGLRHLKPHEKTLAGRRVEGVDARGKALLTRFEGGLVVYSHNLLYGRWYVRKAGERPKTNRKLRFAVTNRKKCALLYSASEIEVLEDAELEGHAYLSKLGPDVLHPRTTPAVIRRRLRSDEFSRRQLGALYLDQGFLAGIGNYLRSDILHVAGVHPSRRPKDLSDDEVAELARATRELSRRAYSWKGATRTRAEQLEAKRAGDSRMDQRHPAYRRGGHPCFECGTKLRRIEHSGRRVFVCPECQRR